MENNISIRIYIQDGKLEQLVPESPWEGQIDVQVVYHDVEFDKLDGELCSISECPEGPELHRHDYYSTAVIRAENRRKSGAYEAKKLPWTKQGPGESHTPREASRDGQILPVDSNKGYRQPACVACGGYEELKPIEPGLFKDAHLCRACGIRARELTEDKDR